MAFELSEGIVSSFVVRLRDELFRIIGCTLETHKLKYKVRISFGKRRSDYISFGFSKFGSLSF